MKRLLTLAAVLAPLAFSAIPSQAAPQSALALAGVTAQTELMTQVQWHGRCGFWRRECAIRWPAFGPRFRRCLAVHGCW